MCTLSATDRLGGDHGNQPANRWNNGGSSRIFTRAFLHPFGWVWWFLAAAGEPGASEQCAGRAHTAPVVRRGRRRVLSRARRSARDGSDRSGRGDRLLALPARATV